MLTLRFTGIRELDTWLDQNAGEMYQVQPLAQDLARVSKIGEEFGEAMAAFIGFTGQNPRKGFTHTQQDVIDELADTLFTCLLAIQHFTKSEIATEGMIRQRWEYRKMMARHPDPHITPAQDTRKWTD